MRITKRSPLTGKLNTRDLTVTEEQMEELSSPGRRHIQDIFPNLDQADREFLKSGYTAEDWISMFPPATPFSELAGICLEVLELLEDQADCDDGEPNRAMRLAIQLRDGLLACRVEVVPFEESLQSAYTNYAMAMDRRRDLTNEQKREAVAKYRATMMARLMRIQGAR